MFGMFLYLKHLYLLQLLVFLLLVTLAVYSEDSEEKRFTLPPLTTEICIQIDKNSLTDRPIVLGVRNYYVPYESKISTFSRHKSCFLRPDTGPCRGDIIQYYFDAMRGTCYRFFWGGCQGNGNRFETKNECTKYCYINSTMPSTKIPSFCSLAFDFGTCFGHYNRWAWDKYAKTCKRRLYSGCGGNQNNFETRNLCMSTCLNPPNNTMLRNSKYTTCIPFTIGNMR